MNFLKTILAGFIIFLQLPGEGRSQTTSGSEDKLKGLKLNRQICDSLIKLINNSPEDTSKVNRLTMLCGTLTNQDADSSMGLANDAFLLSEKLGYKRGMAVALYRMAAIYGERKQDRIKEVEFCRKAIDVAEKNNIFPELHDFYSGIFNSYYYQGQFPSAMDIAQRGLNYAEKRKEQEQVLLYKNNIGNVFYRLGNLKEAEKNYTEALYIAEKINKLEKLASTCLNLTDIYITSKDSSKIFSYVDRAVSIYRDHFEDPAFNGRKHRYSFALFKKAEAFDLIGKPDSAMKYVSQALYLCNSQLKCDLFDVINYYLLAGRLYLKKADYTLSKEYFNKALQTAIQIGHKENTRDSYSALSGIYQAEKKYDSALHFFRLYNQLKDEVTNTETQSAITRIQGEYDVAKKDEVIARQTNLRNIIIGSFIVFLITVGFLYNRYRLRQRNRYQQELNRQQNELFNAIAAAQDQERKRIAQDIHDSLGSILSAAKLKLSALKESQPLLSNEHAEKYQTTLQLLDEASAELRSISHNIMPATLSKLGLVPALKNLSNTISSHSGLQISFSAHDFMERIPEQAEMSIYRIVLELINNIVKHAQANKVTIQLIKYPDYINLSVEDNGRGFDYGDALHEKKGIGLGNILSRVDYLRGKMNVDSLPGRGTTVIIDVPLGNASA